MLALGLLAVLGPNLRNLIIAIGIGNLPKFVRLVRAEALKATPPAEAGPFKASDLVEIVTLDSSIRLDIRYAGTDNFLSTPLYEQARAFLQRPAAEALVRVK